MGDRANVFMVDQKPDSTGLVHGIYLYTHWNGYRWPEMLREALDSPVARGRWEDEQYLARIIVDQLFADLRDRETGGGISTVRGDNSYDIIVLDMLNQRVAFARQGEESQVDNWFEPQSYAQFCTEAPAHYPREDYVEE